MTGKKTNNLSDAIRNLIVCDTQFGWNGATTLKLPELLDLQARGWLIEGDENNEFSLTVEGEAVIARALRQALPAELAEQQGVELPNDPGRTLYIDLDGVMADFDGAFPAIFGLDHRSLADDEMWGHINSHPSFFRDLPPMAGALDFFRSVEHLNPVILTACPKSNYPHVAAQKRAWVRAHLSQTCLVLPVLGGRHKPLFMHQAGDVLIDDFGKNCAAWTAAGGIAIKHEGDWATTRSALALIDQRDAAPGVGNG